MSGVVSHSMWAMPILIVNMGGEMIYILHQRLRAQSVNSDKERKVLQDVLLAMFSPSFMGELFKPQVMYTMSSTKQIFEKLAHSSIMRLNTSSMDKLFDLMAMGVKFQLLSCSTPQQYLHVTFNHLQTMRNIIGTESPVVEGYLQRCEDHFARVYGPRVFGSGQWSLLKTSLLSFYQGKKIKVSLFLQRKVQSPQDGTLYVPLQGRLPPGSEPVGTTRIYDGRFLVRSFVQKAVQVDISSNSGWSTSGGFTNTKGNAGGDGGTGAGSGTGTGAGAGTGTGTGDAPAATTPLTDPWDENFSVGENMYSSTSSLFGNTNVSQDANTRDTILRKLSSLFGDGAGGAPGGGGYSSKAGGAGLRKAGDDKGGSPGGASHPPAKTFASQYSDGAALSTAAARAESKLNAALFCDERGGGGGGAKGGGAGPSVSLLGLLSGASSSSSSGFEPRRGGSSGAPSLSGSIGGFDTETAALSVGYFNLNIEEIDATADAKTMQDMLVELDLVDKPGAGTGLGLGPGEAKWGAAKAPGVGAGAGPGAGAGAGAGAKAQSKAVEMDDDEEDLLALMDSAK